ncbi:hypothetical protein [Streptacidiphilus jiangxiensis]|uniref:Uncharacterized protein n=1 Tax=Streptacidiphilus jiangxiensis TaxID=235985 RepID=A0A1H7NTP2_STRJI|nr:hypothetical protein [Streptacidiphilus jiangxiensis]SEL26398.1 hypothetical protein SAMN05414137_10754 [Streptacidiphilus jiangxiensis]
MYYCELRITEEAGYDARVIAPGAPENLPVSAKELARQHLLAELQSRQFTQEPMPHRVEVRIWEERPDGHPDAAAVWTLDEESLFRLSSVPATESDPSETSRSDPSLATARSQ